MSQPSASRSRSRRIAAASLLVLLLAAGALQFVPAAAPPSPPPRAAPVAPPDAAPPRRIERDAREPATETVSASESVGVPPPAPPPSTQPGVRIRVRVLRTDGTPAAGVAVAALEHEAFRDGFGAKEPPPLAERARGVTAGDGTVVLTTASGALWGGRTVAWDGDDAAAAAKNLYAKFGAEADVELRLERRFRVRGTVVDFEGRRVEDARVRMVIQDVLSTFSSSIGPYGFAVEPLVLERGRFEFAPVAQEEYAKGFVLDVRAEGFHAQAFRIDDADAQRGEIAVRLQRPRSVRGRVVTPDGRPFAGAKVYFRGGAAGTYLDFGGARSADAVTDAEGRYRLTGLSEGGADLVVAATGFMPRTLHAETGSSDETDAGDVVLETGQTIRGDVVDADGRPVEPARVYWQAAEDQRVCGEAPVGPDGRFVLEHVPRGPLRVSVHGEGEFRGWKAALLGVMAGGPPPHVVLTGARQLRLDISYETGSELPADPPYHHVVVTSASDGRVAVDSWPRKETLLRYSFERAGAYDLVVSLDGWEPVRQRVEVSGERETRVAVRMRRATR